AREIRQALPAHEGEIRTSHRVRVAAEDKAGVVSKQLAHRMVPEKRLERKRGLQRDLPMLDRSRRQLDDLSGYELAAPPVSAEFPELFGCDVCCGSGHVERPRRRPHSPDSPLSSPLRGRGLG